jgi:hypothetical protein
LVFNVIEFEEGFFLDNCCGADSTGGLGATDSRKAWVTTWGFVFEPASYVLTDVGLII